MKQERLEILLRDAVMQKPHAPLTPECLDIQRILILLDRPDDLAPDDLRHVATCRHCQSAVALARRERSLIEAPLSQETEEDEGRAAVSTPPRRPSVAPSGRMSRSILLRWLPASAGIAAVVVLAVGLRWWVTPPTMIGPITGQFELRSSTRGDEGPDLVYEITFELKRDAHMTFLYMDHTRELKLPEEVSSQTERYSPDEYPHEVGVTGDPPGPQWIVVVVSEENFDPIALRDELQLKIKAVPEGASFEDVIAELEQALRGRGEITFRGHRFEVTAREAP